MPNKAFAILYAEDSEDSGYLYFPLKRDDAQNYAGMPQFFGGTKEDGESDRETIARELGEESNGKVQLLPGGLVRVYQGTVNGCTYNFYVALNYSGTSFLGPLPGNDEMKAIAKFRTIAGADSDMADLMYKLGLIPDHAFIDSETWYAFDAAIRWAEQPMLIADKSSNAT